MNLLPQPVLVCKRRGGNGYDVVCGKKRERAQTTVAGARHAPTNRTKAAVTRSNEESKKRDTRTTTGLKINITHKQPRDRQAYSTHQRAHHINPDSQIWL